MTQRAFEELSEEECFKLLGQEQVGRFVYQDQIGPVAVPVNFALSGRNIVFRVEGGSKQLAMDQPVLAFEVDRLDEDERRGWSVIARGYGQEVAIDDVPELLRHIEGRPPSPWALGIHNVWLQLVTTSVTGRRLAGEWTSPVF
jgi:nitroimidazol reductase NimA-like FMN-containing flavoprotein (pyridoxamine 5'-phosphate oxidase superfamily)